QQPDRQRGRPDSSRRRRPRGRRRCPATPTPPPTAPGAPPRGGCGERASGLPITANTARPTRYRRDLGGCGGSAPSSPFRRGREALTVPGRAHELVQHGAHLGLRRHLERGRGAGAARPSHADSGLQGPAPRVTGGAAPPQPRGEGGRERACPCLVFPVGSGAGNSPRAGPGAAASRPHTFPYSRSLPRPPRARAGGNGNLRARALRSFVRSATSSRTGLGVRPLATACAARLVTHRAARLLIGPPGRAIGAR
ncbi:hypothetical protein Nmel_005305, partial [Mimus melanotis]